MKYSVTSYQTKKLIAASLIKFMKHKNLNKITITEIIEDCQINRKTFYYHFLDIYDLADWMFGEEAKTVIENIGSLLNYEDILKYVFIYIRKNKDVCFSALNGCGLDQLRVFIVKNIETTIKEIINAADDKVLKNTEYTNFLVKYHSNAIACIYLNWMLDGMTENEDTLIKYLKNTLEGEIKYSLTNIK